MKNTLKKYKKPGRPPKKVGSNKRSYIAGLLLGLVVASVLAYINFL